MKRSNKRIGSIGYATEQGLGFMLKDFFDNGVVDEVLIVQHSSRPSFHREWYPSASLTPARPLDHEMMRRFCLSVDCVLFFETPFDWGLIDFCRRHQVRTVLIPMHECMPQWFGESRGWPNLVINPSDLEAKIWPTSPMLTVPICRRSFPWEERRQANQFLHLAGHGGLKGRNGTRELYESLQYVAKLLDLTICSQGPSPVIPELPPYTCDLTVGQVQLHNIVGPIKREELFRRYDAFVFPEKFNGLSLPIQEAFASGLLVIAGNRHPLNDWLPTDPLIPIASYVTNRIGPAYRAYDSAVIDPKDIASTIDRWNGADISGLSLLGKGWGDANCWDALRDDWRNLVLDSTKTPG